MRHVHRTQVEQGMSEGQHALAVVVGHGAERGDASRRPPARWPRCRPGSAIFPIPARAWSNASRSRRCPARRVHAELLEHRTRSRAERVIGNAGEGQRGIDRHQRGRLEARLRSPAGSDAPAALSGVRASAGRERSLASISSISSIGVMPQIASGENCDSPSESAPISLPRCKPGCRSCLWQRWYAGLCRPFWPG